MALSSPAPQFRAHFGKCDTHGDYQQNFLDDAGCERWLPSCPHCARETRVRSLVDRAAIPPRFQDRTLESYRAESEGQARALRVAQSYAERFDEALAVGRCLTFVGKPGTGKTHLACAIARRVMQDGRTALFVSVSDLIRSVRATWGKKTGKTEEDVLNAYTAVDLLVIDEVGAQYGSEAEQVTLFEVIDRRYKNLRPMIVLSNLPVQSDDPDQPTLKAFLGDRGFDRLREGGGRLVMFDWPSYRRNV